MTSLAVAHDARLRQAVVREAPALRRWAHALARGHDAADLAQDAVVRLLEARPGPVRDPRALMYRAVYTTALDAARRTRRRRREAPVELAETTMARRPTPPDEALACKVDASRLTRAISRLPEAWRDALVRVRVDGTSIPEVAQSLGVSERTVERRLAHATRFCRDAIVHNPLALDT